MESFQNPRFRQKLMAWFKKHGRDLPWRRTADPYQIWISEIMLQQTTVAAVIPYFERFLTECPTVADLAAAPEMKILRLWEGLGYYSRARNLHRAAKVIVEQHSGKFPDHLEGLIALPGIGRYTAGAIASFAFDLRAPIVEANTLRLYCRLLGYDGDPRSIAGQKILWSFAESILPNRNPGKMNQALMELGGAICTPRDPRCDQCPVAEWCQAYRKGTQDVIPKAKSRVAITAITEASIAVRSGARYLLRRRSASERWAGLWDFIRFEIDHDSSTLDYSVLVSRVQELTGLTISLGPQIAEFQHGVTRYKITLKCLVGKKDRGQLRKDDEWKWVSPDQFDHFPLSVTARKFAKVLTETDSVKI